MACKKIGTIIIPPGVLPDPHEKKTADFLAVSRNIDITFLLANRQKGQKTADIEMCGRQWEIKSPKGKSPRTIENNLRLALHQSPYIIIDLRRLDGRIPTKKYLAEVERQFILTVSIRHIIVITKQETIIDFVRK